MNAAETSTTKPTRPTAQSPHSADEIILSRARSILDAEAAAIADARTRLDNAFVGAVRAVLNCRGRICVTGMGKAGLVGQKIQATLASTGTLAYNLHPVEALHGDLGMVHADDVVLALSKSGGSELVQLLPLLKRIGCTVILLTAKLDSPAAAHADHVVDIGHTAEACPLGLAPSSSTVAMLALGDAIALTVMELKSVQPQQYASYHPGGALGRFLTKASEVMRTGVNCPTARDSATLDACFQAMFAAPRRAGATTIVDAQGKLIGIFTLGDLFRLTREGRFALDRPVGEVMTHNPKHVPAEARAMDAIDLMRKYMIDELPVVDDEKRVVGLIDIQDLVARGFSIVENS